MTPPDLKPILAALLACCAVAAHAEDESWSDRIAVTGFATVAGGRVLSGGNPGWTNRLANKDCGCVIVDWAHASVYNKDFSLNEESRLGLQFDASLTSNLSATLQLVARSAPLVKKKIDVEWLYGTYNLSPNWTLQAGRKRLPMFYYSDFQDIGNAFPWVRPNAEVYGWDIVNYNGANLTYRDTFGELALRSSVFAGGEKSKNFALGKIFALNQYNQTDPWDIKNRTDAQWSNIVGVDAELNYDWLTGRAVYLTFDDQQFSYATGSPVPTSPKRKREIYGYTLVADIDDWLLRHEFSYFNRDHAAEAPTTNWISSSLSAGYRWHKLTGMVTRSVFKTAGPGAVDHRINMAYTLRYDLTAHSDVKLQLDQTRPAMANGAGATTGRSRTATVAYDLTF